MTVRARASSSRMGSMGSLIRRTADHFRSGRANRISLFNRNRGAGSQTSQSRRSGRDTGSTTKYADSSTLYRRRPAPRKLRNRVRKFAARVQSVIDGEVGLQVAVIPYATAVAGYSTPVVIQTLVNTQTSALIPGLYSANGSHPSTSVNGNWYDLYEVFQAFYSSTALGDDSILEFTNGVWNCAMTNVTGNGSRAIVDMYECVARRDWKPTDNPYSIYTNFFPSTNGFAGSSGNNQISLGQLGVTPFDNPVFRELFKILKVRRIKLEDGATATLQFRDPKHRKMEYLSKVSNKSSIKGVTRFWLPIVYGAPNYLSSTNMRSCAVTVNIDCVRNYHFRQLSKSTPSASAVSL